MRWRFAKMLHLCLALLILFSLFDLPVPQFSPPVQAAASTAPAQPATEAAPAALAPASAKPKITPTTGTKLYAWGYNFDGQLGNLTNVGITNSANPTPTLVTLPGQTPGSNITLVASGVKHSLAATSDGKLYAWGADGQSQLGYAGPSPNPTPTLVNLPMTPGATITVLAAGFYNSFAATSDGKLYAWGQNSLGQLGINQNIGSQVNNPTVVTLPGLTPGARVTAIAAGYTHTLVATSDGKLYAFGSNAYGETSNCFPIGGSANYTPTILPLPLTAGATIDHIAAGSGFSLAASSDGKLWAWGLDNKGQLGDAISSDTNPHPTPISITLSSLTAGATVTTLGAGYWYSMAATSDGKLWAWGYNASGQLGDAVLPDANGIAIPTRVTLPGLISGTDTTVFDGGTNHSLAVTGDGTIWTWGDNQYGQLGNTNNVGQINVANSTPQPVTSFGSNVQVVAAAAGLSHVLALVNDTGNTTWPAAQPLSLSSAPSNTFTSDVAQYLGQPGGSKWFKVQPGANTHLSIKLTGPGGGPLPANYDLAFYKDLQVQYNSFGANPDLTKLSAQAAPPAYLPPAYLPPAYLPPAYLPPAYLPPAYLPPAYLPPAYLQELFPPIDQLVVPPGYDPVKYGSALVIAFLDGSANEGTQTENIERNTWSDTNSFYIQVKARDNNFSLDTPFELHVVVSGLGCPAITAPTAPAFTAPTSTQPVKTLLLTDWSRLDGLSSDKTSLQTKLASFAARSDVQGLVLNLGDTATYPRVAQANSQADANPLCPFAKNGVATEIKAVIQAYRAVHPELAYIVLVGSDRVIPFFRYPDQAGLAPESDYYPPVQDNGTAQAALRNNLVLGQDEYGASQRINRGSYAFPTPDLPVGRLVETAADINKMLDAYVATNGVVTPQTALVTGYDFTADTAQAVQGQLQNALNCSGANCPAVSSLIAPQGQPITTSWSAANLRSQLVDRRNDLIFVSGHADAGSLQAPDLSLLSAKTLAESTINHAGSIIIGLGCHSTYNIAAADVITGSTPDPDWPQAFARQGMTAIGGTGYQYGDTSAIEYGERLYYQLSIQLHTLAPGQNPPANSNVALGAALVAAKKHYLADTSPLNGMHEKVLLETALYGLPMLRVQLNGVSPAADNYGASSIVNNLNNVSGGPGQSFGLQTADLPVATSLRPYYITLTNPSDNSIATSRYYSATDGIVANPLAPVLPLEVRSVGVTGTVLRGVGFLGGHYQDNSNVFPLTGGPTTENGQAHSTFASPTFFPDRIWSVNYLDALNGGSTRLEVTPAQYESNSDPRVSGGLLLTGTLRTFSDVQVRLYYSSYPTSSVAAPVIKSVQFAPNSGGTALNILARVVGGSAGVQEVWINYTADNGSFGGQWQSLFLTADASDGTLWKGSLQLNGTPANAVYFMVQAVNGLGQVALDSNADAYYRLPVPPPAPAIPLKTVLTIAQPADGSQIVWDSQPFIQVQAQYVDPNDSTGQHLLPLVGATVNVSFGPSQVQVTTDGSGIATVNSGQAQQVVMTVLAAPGSSYPLTAKFDGALVNANNYYNLLPASAAPVELNVVKQPTNLQLIQAAPAPANSFGITATLRDGANAPLGQKPVLFVGTSIGNAAQVYGKVSLTNSDGQAALGSPRWPAGTYKVCAYFGTNGPTNLNLTNADPDYAASYDCTGNPQVTIDLTVTQASDTGDTDAVGTLSYALWRAGAGQTISFSPTNLTNNTVQVKGALPPLPASVTLQGGCGPSGSRITIDGSQTPLGTDGLIVSGGSTVSGIALTGFTGRSLVVNSGGNRFTCFRVKAGH